MIEMRNILQHQAGDDKHTQMLVEYLTSTPYWDQLEREGLFFRSMRAYPNTSSSEVAAAKQAMIGLCRETYRIEFGQMCVLLLRETVEYPKEIKRVLNSFLSGVEFLCNGATEYYRPTTQEIKEIQELRLNEIKSYLQKLYTR